MFLLLTMRNDTVCTGTWWCSKTKTLAVPDFMAIIHVLIPGLYILSTYQYILVCTIFSITYQYVLGTDWYIPVCTKNPDFVPLVTIPDAS
jgi:hypothetical protein